MLDAFETRLQARESQMRRDRALALLIIQAIAAAMGVAAAEITSRRSQSREVRRARKASLYLAHTALGWPLHRVGAAFDRDRTTVGVACRETEDLRENAEFDRLLDRLGGAVREIVACGAHG